MSETVVHVTTLEQWKSVLDVWFEQGYSWYSGYNTHMKNYFKDGNRELLLDKDNDILIPISGKREPITYSEFMAQQKGDNKMETYYVTQEQLDFLNTIYEELYSLDELLNQHIEAKKLFDDFSIPEGNAVLRYLGGDETIEFKVKEQLYRLVRINERGDEVWFRIFSGYDTDWTFVKEYAFTAPLEEIKKWQTPDWKIEKDY